MNRFNKIAAHIMAQKKVSEEVQQFTSLNDATFVVESSANFTKGNTEIWYMKPSFTRDGLMGVEWLEEHGQMPDVMHLTDTHKHLGSIRETNMDKIYHLMQGDVWSPRGQARTLIQRSGLNHTSMSVGDIVVVHGETFIVDNIGFKKLK